MPISGAHFNLAKPISLALDNGYDTVSEQQIGPKTGTCEELTDFPSFYSAYLTQLAHVVDTYLDALVVFEKEVQDVNPSLMFSATMAPCVDTLTDAIDGAVDNYTGIVVAGFGSAVDSLLAVKELVYDKKLVSLAELNDILHKNWEGQEELRHRAFHTAHRYGNGDPVADHYAAALTRFLSDRFSYRRNGHGGRVIFEMHSARAHIDFGRSTLATPDGRPMGAELSKNATPAPGSDRSGATALIKSATAIDSSLCNCGFCLDMMLHPSAVQGEDGMKALYAVLMTYLEKGGASIHFNIFDPATLRDAQEHPEKYQNLQVRVCGWNALWNNMDKTEQDAYILRAENLR